MKRNKRKTVPIVHVINRYANLILASSSSFIDENTNMFDNKHSENKMYSIRSTFNAWLVMDDIFHPILFHILIQTKSNSQNKNLKKKLYISPFASVNAEPFSAHSKFTLSECFYPENKQTIRSHSKYIYIFVKWRWMSISGEHFSSNDLTWTCLGGHKS